MHTILFCHAFSTSLKTLHLGGKVTSKGTCFLARGMEEAVLEEHLQGLEELCAQHQPLALYRLSSGFSSSAIPSAREGSERHIKWKSLGWNISYGNGKMPLTFISVPEPICECLLRDKVTSPRLNEGEREALWSIAEIRWNEKKECPQVLIDHHCKRHTHYVLTCEAKVHPSVCSSIRPSACPSLCGAV